MDSSQFDRLARIIGSGQSRRSVLKTLAGGALGAAVAAARIGGAGAANKRTVGNACSANADCESNFCVQETRTREICHCASPGDCPQATGQCGIATCQSGVCGIGVNQGALCDDGNACTQDTTCRADGSCAGSPVVCTDGGNACVTATCDPVSGCGTTPKPRGSSCSDANACNGAEACDGSGSCLAGIPVVCGSCTACNVQTGACDDDPTQNGVPCDDSDPCTTNDVCQNGVCQGIPLDCALPNTEATHCAAGVCVIDACSTGYRDCDGNPDTGCEANLDSDPNHCGDCATVCPDDENGRGASICTDGVCGLDCDGALVECPSNPGVCSPLTTTSNCGACGTACPDPAGGHGQAICSAGHCDIQCDGGYTACNGVCVDLTTDAANCGVCGLGCSLGADTCCGGACVSLDAADHCGACGTVCFGDADACCDGVCLALDTPDHCGACGNVCDGDDVCCSGGCFDCCADTDCPGSYSSCAGNVCNTVCADVTVTVSADYSSSVPNQFYATVDVRGPAQGTALTFTLLDANGAVVPGGGSSTFSGYVTGYSKNSSTICLPTGFWQVTVAGCGVKAFPFVTNPGCPPT